MLWSPFFLISSKNRSENQQCLFPVTSFAGARTRKSSKPAAGLARVLVLLVVLSIRMRLRIRLRFSSRTGLEQFRTSVGERVRGLGRSESRLANVRLGFGRFSCSVLFLHEFGYAA